MKWESCKVFADNVRWMGDDGWACDAKEGTITAIYFSFLIRTDEFIASGDDYSIIYKEGGL